ncbi:MAG: hypothetical protein WA658_09810 [Candidatus Acidiferrales bacterium]
MNRLKRMGNPSQREKVYVVVDPAFGEKLALLPPGSPVWIVDTPVNKAVAERIWRERPGKSHLDGVTTFCVCSDSPEENFLGELGTIDLHHGSYSSDHPYSRLEVIGVPVSEKIKLAMAEYGFAEFRANSGSFEAIRQA